MAVTLTIRSENGSVTLTPYLDVEAGKGLEPGSPSFTNKVFAHSLLKPGATLALEDLQLKEQVFPVKLTAHSKDALAELVAEINLVINTPGAQVEWQDEGASRPTYYDLASGQFDDEFDYRLGQNNWLKGRLRLFSQPLGYWSREGARQVKVSGVATSTRIGTSPVVVFPASGAFDGDAPALIQGSLLATNWLEPESFTAMSLLPSASYVPWVSITSRLLDTPFGFTFSVASNAPGGTVGRWVKPDGEEFVSFAVSDKTKFDYTGDQRLLLAARIPPGFRTTTVESLQPGGELGELPLTTRFNLPATSTWSLYDLGVARAASSALAHGEDYRWFVNLISPFASSAIEIAGIVQLPDANTAWLNGQGLRLPVTVADSFRFSYDGVSNSVYYGADIGVPASGVAPTDSGLGTVDRSGFARGVIPPVPAAVAPQSIAMLAMNYFGATNNAKLTMTLNVLERFRYAA